MRERERQIERELSFIHLIALISAELTQTTLRRDNFMSLPKQMQLDIQKPRGGGKTPRLIIRADDRRLGGRVEVPLNAAMTDQITESKRP